MRLPQRRQRGDRHTTSSPEIHLLFSFMGFCREVKKRIKRNRPEVVAGIVVWIFICFWPEPARGFKSELHGELSGWMTYAADEKYEASAGLRYIPVLTLKKKLAGDVSLDSKISVNAYGTGDFDRSDSPEYDGEVKPYRMWLRLSTSQLELRAGLQKISFGSATLLRPLMWFDRIDPRDPLQLTEGVYGLLGRYYFLNNANIWLWGLYGNDDAKGLEDAPTDEDHLEYGGRVQTPFYSGEIAVSYHHRKAFFENEPTGKPFDSLPSVSEDRVGIDGKWDLGVGAWFEGVLIHQNRDASGSRYQRLLNVGLDYTFDWGDGIHTIVEQFVAITTDKPFGGGDRSNISAVSISYPVGLIDRLSTIVSYDWESDQWFRYAAWQRTYDNWSFFLMGFWSPSDSRLSDGDDDRPGISGKGVRVMFRFNH